jgi:hypothetical protein
MVLKVALSPGHFTKLLKGFALRGVFTVRLAQVETVGPHAPVTCTQ